MKLTHCYDGVCLLLLSVFIGIVQPTCVLESDFGFKINCAFKKSGLFRVRNLGGIKAHASLGFSLGDELGFEQSLTNMDPSRRRSVNIKNGAPPNIIAEATPRPAGKQEKRGKQNRIMMRPPAPVNRPNPSAMNKLTSLHRRVSSTMQPIVVPGPTIETPTTLSKVKPTVTMAKPLPMGVPPFRPLPPKEDTLKVVPIAATKKSYSPLQIPQSKGPGVAYKSENYPHVSYDQVSKMVSQMTASHIAQPHIAQPHIAQPHFRITPSPIIMNTPRYSITTVNPFVPMPVAAPPTQAAISIIPAPILKNSVQIPLGPLSKTPNAYSLAQNTISIQKTVNPISNFVDPVPHQVHDLASQYPVFSTKKVDDYNTITGYGDDTALKFNKEEINAKIAEIARVGNISMEAVEAAIALRQQQLLSKYANIPMPTTSSTTTTTTTTTTESTLVFQPEMEPEIVMAPVPHKPKRNPTSGKVMNAPREYYPVGYEKNFDDHFQSKVDLPDTNFHCGDQKYFPGLYGDESLGCMVFHVCALTDDGLIMKSFLCPESTLFDQTILKCNWWFYVDCKNTRRLYDTNIPVSKSYQLMKALTFFSSYKKEMQEDGAHPTNPEDVEGIKEAISILENQDTDKPAQPINAPNALQIITPQPIVDERSNFKRENSNQTAPVYRANRNFRNSTNNDNNSNNNNRKNYTNLQAQESLNDFKLVTVNADLNFNKEKANNSKINSSEQRDVERRHRRRMTTKTNVPTAKPTTTSKPETTPAVEIIKQEIKEIKNPNLRVQQEKLTDQIDTSRIDPAVLKEAENAPEVKRFYRSSAEKVDAKEIAMVNNEKVQIIRPTPVAKLVGEFQTPTATIAKLDEAILGRPYSARFKKEVVIVTARTQLEPQSPTNPNRT